MGFGERGRERDSFLQTSQIPPGFSCPAVGRVTGRLVGHSSSAFSRAGLGHQQCHGCADFYGDGAIATRGNKKLSNNNVFSAILHYFMEIFFLMQMDHFDIIILACLVTNSHIL